MSSRVTQMIADMLAKYRSAGDYEFEIRFRGVTKEIFSSLFNAIKTSPDHRFLKIEHSLNAISSNLFNDGAHQEYVAESFIRRQVFENLKRIEDVRICKSADGRPIHVNDFLSYNIALNKEIPIEDFQTKMDANVRMKIRASFTTADSQYRIDITAVKQSIFKQIGPQLPALIKSMFAPKTIDNFLSEIQYDQINSFEIELEHIGDKTKLTPDTVRQAIESIFVLISPTHVHEYAIRNEVASIANDILERKDMLGYYTNGSYGLKSLLNKPRSFTSRTYAEVYPPYGMFVTEKADGVRCAIKISGGKCRFVLHKLYEVIGVEDATIGTTIADSELIAETNAEGAVVSIRVLVFDVMMNNGTNVTQEKFSERIEHAVEVVDRIKSLIASATSAPNFHIDVGVKKFTKLTEGNLKRDLVTCYIDTKYPYEIDGLMFAEDNGSYADTNWWKWKPIANTTIDFLAVGIDATAPSSKKKKAESPTQYSSYALFVGIQYEMQRKLGIEFMPNYTSIFPDYMFKLNATYKKEYMYYPIQFSPSINPRDYIYEVPAGTSLDLHMKIVEMRKELTPQGEIGPWSVVRVRDDRKIDANYFGNDYQTAELTYQNYISPLHFENLYDFSAGYFGHDANVRYKAKNAFHRFVVSSLIQKYTCVKPAINLGIDFGSGRGADLHRFQECAVQRMLFIDRDRNALTELIQRKFQMMNDKRRIPRAETKDQSKGMSIHVLHADLFDSAESITERMKVFNIEPGNANFANCSFAIHYFCDTVAHLRNFIKLVNSVLAIGAYFTCTTMNGEKVFSLLRKVPIGDTFKITENGATKYEIKRLYTGERFGDTNQNIAVALPFADEMYEEPLCNIPFVVREFEKHGFSLDLSDSFASYSERCKIANGVLFQQLTPADMQYIELHQFLSFRKMKNV